VPFKKLESCGVVALAVRFSFCVKAIPRLWFLKKYGLLKKFFKNRFLLFLAKCNIEKKKFFKNSFFSTNIQYG